MGLEQPRVEDGIAFALRSGCENMVDAWTIFVRVYQPYHRLDEVPLLLDLSPWEDWLHPVLYYTWPIELPSMFTTKPRTDHETNPNMYQCNYY
jgi:hypothetical protein